MQCHSEMARNALLDAECLMDAAIMINCRLLFGVLRYGECHENA